MDLISIEGKDAVLVDYRVEHTNQLLKLYRHPSSIPKHHLFTTIPPNPTSLDDMRFVRNLWGKQLFTDTREERDRSSKEFLRDNGYTRRKFIVLDKKLLGTSSYMHKQSRPEVMVGAVTIWEHEESHPKKKGMVNISIWAPLLNQQDCHCKDILEEAITMTLFYEARRLGIIKTYYAKKSEYDDLFKSLGFEEVTYAGKSGLTKMRFELEVYSKECINRLRAAHGLFRYLCTPFYEDILKKSTATKGFKKV